MFIAHSKFNSLEATSLRAVEGSVISAPADLKEARKNLQAAFVKAGFCDRNGKLRLRLGDQSPLSDDGRKRLNGLLMHQMSLDGRLLLLQEYVNSMILPTTGLPHWKYLRGSYAAYLIDPLSRLKEALELFYVKNPKAKEIIEPAFVAYCQLKVPIEEPNDADFADLYYDEKRSISEDTVQKIKNIAVSWIAGFLKKAPEIVERTAFHTLFIPEPNHLTKTAEKIAIITLKTDPPAPGGKEIKVDRVMGELSNYCLFSRDDFYIDIQHLPYYPQSFQNPFWQCVLDREMQVIRLEKRHREDFSSVLAAMEHYTKDAEIDESEITLAEIFEAFLTPLTEEKREDEKCRKMELTDEKLIHAVLKRIENHAVDPLSFLVNLCAHFPGQFSDRREVLWKGVINRLDSRKLGNFAFLAQDTPSFDLFIYLQGTREQEGHHFRIEKVLGGRIESTGRHFRKLPLMQKDYRPLEGHLDVWQQGCKTLHSPSKGAILTVDFVDQLVEDLLDGSVYSDTEVAFVLGLCQPYWGKIKPQSWLEDLLKGPFWEIALKHWGKTAEAMSLEHQWTFLSGTLPIAARNKLRELLSELLGKMDAQERIRYLLENYAQLHAHYADIIRPMLVDEMAQGSLQDRCRTAAILFDANEWSDLKTVVFMIDPVPEEIRPEWTKWAVGLISHERLDAAATKLFCQLNSRTPIKNLPKKQADRVHYGIQEFSQEELTAYVGELMHAGEIFECLSFLPKLSVKGPILSEAVSKLPSASSADFKDCVSYISEYFVHLDPSWIKVISLLSQQQQIELLSGLLFDVAAECRDQARITQETYTAVILAMFKKKPSLQLLWELEYVQAVVDEAIARKVLSGYRSAKQLMLNDAILVKRLNWLISRKKFVESFSLLKKCGNAALTQEWMDRLMTSYLQEAPLSDLNAYFSKEEVVTLPENVFAERLENEDDLKIGHSLYQKFKSHLSAIEQRKCLLFLFKKQVAAPLLTGKEMQGLLPDGLSLLGDDCSTAIFTLLITFMLKAEKCDAVLNWLRDARNHLNVSSLSLEIQHKWLALYVLYQLPLSPEHVPLAEDALCVGAPVEPVWLFKQIAMHRPERLEALPVDKLPIDRLFDPVFEQMVSGFSCDQLWKVYRSIQADSKKTLRLFRAWHARGDIEHETVQKEMMANASDQEPLYPLLNWLREGNLHPVGEWAQRFMLFDEAHLSYYFELLREPEDGAVRMQLIEFCIQHRKAAFCMEHAPSLTTILRMNKASFELQNQLQQVLLTKFTEKKAWTFEEVQRIVSILDQVTDSATLQQYHLLLSVVLVDLSSSNYRAQMALLELMKREIVPIEEANIAKLLSFIETNYALIYQDLNAYDGFLTTMLKAFSQSQEVISQFLFLWDGWRTDLRLTFALKYIVDHPGAGAKSITKQLIVHVLESKLTIREIQHALSNLVDSIAIKEKLKIELLIQLLAARKAIQNNSDSKAVRHFFGYLNILGRLVDSDDSEYEVEKHLQGLLKRLLDRKAFKEINLLFERFALYSLKPNDLIIHTDSLEFLIQRYQDDDQESQIVSFAMQRTLEAFFECVERHLPKACLGRSPGVLLNKMHESGSPVPQQWFPYYQEYIAWHCQKLKFVLNKTPAPQFRVLVPSILTFIECAISHPACNASTFLHVRNLTLDLFLRCDDASYVVLMFKQFVLVESMQPLPQRVYECPRMKSMPEIFTNTLRRTFEGLLQDLQRRGSLMDYQRAFAFLNYSIKSYRKLLGAYDGYAISMIKELVAKLYHASPEFKCSIIPQAHALLDMMNETKFTKEHRAKLQKWKI